MTEKEVKVKVNIKFVPLFVDKLFFFLLEFILHVAHVDALFVIASVAQSVEHHHGKVGVGGSNPPGSLKFQPQGC